MAKKLSRPQILAIGTILDCARPFRKPVAFNILTGMYEIRSSTLDALERQDMIKRNPRHEYEVTESGIAEYRKAAPGRLETMEAYDTSKAAAPAQPAGDFGVGDVVTHVDCPAWGKGTILRLMPDGENISVKFEHLTFARKIDADKLTLWKPAEPGSDAADNEIPADVAIEVLEHQKRNAEYHMEGYRDALEKVRKTLRLFQGDDFYVSMAIGIIDGTLEDEALAEAVNS